jgi:hypothetical protein
MNPLKKRHYWTHQQTYQKCCINSLVSLAIRGKFSLIKHANHCCSPGLLQTLALGFYWFCWPILLILNLLYCDFSLCVFHEFSWVFVSEYQDHWVIIKWPNIKIVTNHTTKNHNIINLILTIWANKTNKIPTPMSVTNLESNNDLHVL